MLFICFLLNTHNNLKDPVYGVTTICHQVYCMRWGHPSLFHIAMSLLTHWGRVTHMCVGNLTSLVQIWLVAWSAPSHYLNQCWNIVIGTLRNKLQWTLNRKYNILITENAFECVVCDRRPFCLSLNVLSWYEMVSMGCISYSLIWTKFIGMLSMYVHYGAHRYLHWRLIAVLTNDLVFWCLWRSMMSPNSSRNM